MRLDLRLVRRFARRARAVALALPLAFYVILANVQSLARDKAPTPQISLFMALDAQAPDLREIDNRLKKHAAVAQS